MSKNVLISKSCKMCSKLTDSTIGDICSEDRVSICSYKTCCMKFELIYYLEPKGE